MALYGVGLDANIKRIHLEMRIFMSEHSGKFISRLETIFIDLDKNHSGLLSYFNFEQGINKFGFFPKVVDMQALFKYYDKDQTKFIPYETYLADLALPLTERELRLVDIVWNHLNPEGLETIRLEDLVSRINPEMLKNLTRRKTHEETIKDIYWFFENKPDINKDDLKLYFTDLSNSIPSEEYFVDLIQKTFKVKEADYEIISKDNVKDFIKTLRTRLINYSKGMDSDEYVLRRAFEKYDIHKTGLMGIDELKGILAKIEMLVDKVYLEGIFLKLDEKKTGYIEFEKFLKLVMYDMI